MRLDKLAITAQEAFQNSMGVASDAESAVIQPIHLLKALLDADENNLAGVVVCGSLYLAAEARPLLLKEAEK